MTQEELKDLLDYDPETGIFRWKVYRNQYAKVGDIAGNLRPDSYRQIKINGKFYLEHRLAWFYIYGEWPENQIDHINGMKTDNRIKNLREADRFDNTRNVKRRKDNSSGYKGVSLSNGKWMARIWSIIDNKRKRCYLGYFNSPEEAYAAYCKAAKELHGEFANCD